jgi:diguanylate cyclase (GGDEF)-like protein
VRLSDAYESISRSRQLVKISIALIVALIFGALSAIWGLRQGAITETVDDNRRLGIVLAEQIARTFQAVDFVLRDLSEKIAGSDVHDRAALHAAFGDAAMHEALAKRHADLPQTGAFTILDTEGRYVNKSRDLAATDISFADRSFFRHFATTQDSGLFISEPLVSRVGPGVPTVYLARRLTAPDGSFLGVAAAAIEVSYFDTFFANTGFRAGTNVRILRADGVVLVHYPRANLRFTRVPEDSPWYATVRSGGGYYRSPGTLGGRGPYLVFVQPLGSGSIVVDVARLEAAALARWVSQAMAICAGVLAVTIGFGILLLALTRQITIIEISQRRIQEQVDAARRSEARLAEQSALLETTLDHMNQGLMMVDAAGVVAVCNRRAMEILELPPALMAAHPPIADVVEYQTRNGEFVGWTDNRLDPAVRFTHHSHYERRRPNGAMIEVQSAALPGGGMVRTYSDITARTAAEEMLGVAASHDQLTGLINRHAFGIRHDTALAEARRDNSQVAVLCLDLDRFKAVNDTLGHAAGDQLLVLVAQRMGGAVRSTDVVARLGGDEFAIIAARTNLTEAQELARRLLDAIRLPYAVGGGTVRIGISIGVAMFPADAGTAEQLLRNADTALYKAKAAGRDTWRAYASEDGQRQHERMALELDFRTAVAVGQFSLVYQPICDAVTGSPVAFEALVRWNHPIRGVISPAEFIPVAEQTGLIIPLGRWIIETACAAAAGWPEAMRLAVNLSPAQFRERGLIGFVRELLARVGLAPARLDFEVTEGLLFEDAEDVVSTMRALSALGIRMVLDDFGTAHSNLSYLRGFPFEAVKIDRTFMRALNTDRDARAIVEAILVMARALGLEVIGEGVETQEQLGLLRHLGCRLVQGYFLGYPASAQETLDRLWRRSGSRFAATDAGPARRPAVNA